MKTIQTSSKYQTHCQKYVFELFYKTGKFSEFLKLVQIGNRTMWSLQHRVKRVYNLEIAGYELEMLWSTQ